jgi:hypothetical protein
MIVILVDTAPVPSQLWAMQGHYTPVAVPAPAYDMLQTAASDVCQQHADASHALVEAL